MSQPAYMSMPWFALLVAQVSPPGVVHARIARQLARIFHACSQRRAQRGIAARI
ncbi:hypothetical protein [Comamonas denitrificans]|uniref:hypothetical protein n=1 Tax=Comamonas denitrificans TaxID=117506 RepID=UPI0036204A88